jgi:hypothetical protein
MYSGLNSMISIELNSIQPVQWPEIDEPYQNPKLYFAWSKPTLIISLYK